MVGNGRLLVGALAGLVVVLGVSCSDGRSEDTTTAPASTPVLGESPATSNSPESTATGTNPAGDNAAGPDSDTPVPLDLTEGASTYKGLSLQQVDNGAPVVTPVDGVIGVVCIGMSNSWAECRDYIERAESGDFGPLNPQLRFANCAVSGHAIERWNDPSFDRELWNECLEKVLPRAGLAPEQVRVIWHKAADQETASRETREVLPPYPDPESDYFRFIENLTVFAQRLPQKLPSVQAVYVTSRSYGGFVAASSKGEPLSYEEGLALNEWLRQNPEVGGVWYGWGPYIWAPECDAGTNGSGVCYVREDFSDGVHLENSGLAKISGMLHDRFSEHDWYLP